MRAALLGLLAIPLLLFASCGDDDDVSARPQSTGGVQGGPSPRLEGPASLYAPGVEEMPGYFEVIPPETYRVTDEIWARSSQLFPAAADGEAFAQQNGFLDGWQVTFAPDGLIAGVVGSGRYYVTIQTYLFESPSGAGATFEKYREGYDSIAGSDPASASPLGNRSGGWEYLQGTVGTTDVVGAYHRFVFQRGNLLAVVQTYGAETFMSIDVARELARLVDNRALGTSPAVEPTPILPRLPTPDDASGG